MGLGEILADLRLSLEKKGFLWICTNKIMRTYNDNASLLKDCSTIAEWSSAYLCLLYTTVIFRIIIMIYISLKDFQFQPQEYKNNCRFLHKLTKNARK